MKRILSLLIAICTVSLSTIALANVKDIGIRYFARYQADEECAVEAEIREVEEGMINGSEAMYFGGFPVANFAGLPQPPAATYYAGDRILFASDALSLKLGLKLGINYDIALKDEDCADLAEGDSISFSGSFGNPITGITLPSLSLNLALAYDSNLNDDAIDLESNSIELFSLNDKITLGSGPLYGSEAGSSDTSSTGTSNTCQLMAGVPAAGSALPQGIIMILGLAALAGIRRRHCQQ